MTNLKRGLLYITKEDILSYTGLSDDTHLEFVPSDNGVEIKVFTN